VHFECHMLVLHYCGNFNAFDLATSFESVVLVDNNGKHEYRLQVLRCV